MHLQITLANSRGVFGGFTLKWTGSKTMNFVENMCEVIILETSNTHGHVYPINYGNNKEMNVGLAKLENLIEHVSWVKNNLFNRWH